MKRASLTIREQLQTKGRGESQVVWEVESFEEKLISNPPDETLSRVLCILNIHRGLIH
jgi:hypothetical protein